MTMPGQTEAVTLDYAIVCDDVRFEKDEKISCMGLFDSIRVGSFPTQQPRLAVVAAYAGLRDEAVSEIELVDPNGTVVGTLAKASLKATGEKKGARHIAISLNVPFKAPGIYLIRVRLNGQMMKIIQLPVRSAETPRTGFAGLGVKR